MASKEELRELLPKMRFNESHKKREKYKYKKRVEAREKEMELAGVKKRSKRVDSAEKAVKLEIQKKSSKKEGADGKGKVKKVAKEKKKVRAPKLKVSNAETGKETLKKKTAREMVAASKKKANKSSATASLKSKQVSAAKMNTVAPSSSSSGAQSSKSKKNSDAVVAKKEQQEQQPAVHSDRELLARAIRGNDLIQGDALQEGAALLGHDAVLYPELEFLDEYAARKHAEVVSADQLLQNAHHFFKDLGKRERALNQVAKEHIRRLHAVNRRGGDKEGFRYVVPKNVKNVVREMLAQQRATEGGEEDAEALVDPQTLVSTFGGDAVAETSDKPMRRPRRKRSHKYSDFYQFQVSNKWTRNAENFLKRSRPNRKLFEEKKHQRSIKNF